MADLQFVAIRFVNHVATAAEILQPYKGELLNWRKITCRKIIIGLL